MPAKKQLPQPWEVERRKPLTPQQKARMFLAWDAKCCICGCQIDHLSEAWDEHINPLWLTGTNGAANRGPAHERCTKPKTKREAKQRSKIRKGATRQLLGARARKGPPMPGSRDSKWKRKMNGTWERRQ